MMDRLTEEKKSTAVMSREASGQISSSFSFSFSLFLSFCGGGMGATEVWRE